MAWMTSRPKLIRKLVGGGKPSSLSDTSVESRAATFRKSLSVRRSERAAISPDSGLATPDDRVKRKQKPPSLSRRPNHSRSIDGGPNQSVKSPGPHDRSPSFLKQPLHRGADDPVVLKDDPRLHKRKEPGRGSVAAALDSRDWVKEGDTETTYHRLLRRALFALLGFGRCDVGWRIGSYGGNFTDLIRWVGTDNAEDLRAAHVKCKIADSISAGFPTLKMGAAKLGFADEQNLILCDFTQVPNSASDEHLLAGGFY